MDNNAGCYAAGAGAIICLTPRTIWNLVKSAVYSRWSPNPARAIEQPEKAFGE